MFLNRNNALFLTICLPKEYAGLVRGNPGKPSKVLGYSGTLNIYGTFLKSTLNSI